MQPFWRPAQAVSRIPRCQQLWPRRHDCVRVLQALCGTPRYSVTVTRPRWDAAVESAGGGGTKRGASILETPPAARFNAPAGLFTLVIVRCFLMIARSGRFLRLEALEHRRLLAGEVSVQPAIEFSADEQLMLELVNRARANPVAEATRLGIDLNEGLPTGTLGPEPRPPLAPHAILNDVAAAHSLDMIDRKFFSHVNPDGEQPWTRADDAGYPANGIGENIAARTLGFNDLAGNTRRSHEQLFLSSGHRRNILDDWKEVGLGIEIGPFDYSTVQGAPSMITTQLFGAGPLNVFAITGVAFEDSLVMDDFYSVGEGQPGVLVEAIDGQGQRYTTTTGGSGGYALRVPSGSYQVTAWSADGTRQLDFGTIEVTTRNLKLDVRVEALVEPNPSPQSIVLAGAGIVLDLADPLVNLEGIQLIDIRGNGGNTLQLDAARIGSFAAGGTIAIVADADDEIQFDAGWSFSSVERQADRLVRRFANQQATVNLTGAEGWFTNPIDPFDANGSGDLSALDSLVIINELASRRFSIAPDGTIADLDQYPLEQFGFFDVNQDNHITALDALRVINEMARASLSAEGELEPLSEQATSLVVASTSVPSQDDRDSPFVDDRLAQDVARAWSLRGRKELWASAGHAVARTFPRCAEDSGEADFERRFDAAGHSRAHRPLSAADWLAVPDAQSRADRPS